MELRVHGIGGPTAESVLAVPPGTTCRAVWRGEPPGHSAVRVAPGDGSTAVYHWAPLTSGSRWFALWPLLLPFTVLNVAGFMSPRGGVRGPLAQQLVRAVALTATVTWVGWSLLAGQLVLGRDGDAWQGTLLGTALALAPFAVSQYTRQAFELFPGSPRASSTSRHRDGAGLANPKFFDGKRHRFALWLHLLAACAALAWVARQGRTRPGGIATAAGDVVVGAGVVAAALVVAVAVVSFRRRRRWWSGSPMAAAVGMGLVLLGGMASAAIQWSVGSCPSNPTAANAPDGCRLLQGKPWMLVDLFGWALLVGLGVAAAAVVYTMRRPRADERLLATRGLLPSLEARMRARLARLPARLGAVAGGATLAFFVVGALVFPARAWPVGTTQLCDDLPAVDDLGLCGVAEHRLPPAGDVEPWVMTDTPPVTIARWAFLGLLGFVGLNLVKSRASPNVLRRVGSIWDVLSFWPRSFHPLAVRPYSERAVPELRTLLTERPQVLGNGELVVTAHSQGSVLVAAALASSPTCERTRLLTMGAPLRTLYAQAFPRYVGTELFDTVRAAVGDSARWRNVFRFTDHVGRSIFADDEPWEDTPGDRPLRDPSAGGPVQGHNAYWRDAEVNHILRSWQGEPSVRSRTDA